jgi:hypothetical protein
MIGSKNVGFGSLKSVTMKKEVSVSSFWGQGVESSMCLMRRAVAARQNLLYTV